MRWNPLSWRRDKPENAPETAENPQGSGEKRYLDVDSVPWGYSDYVFPDAINVDRVLRLAPVYAAGRLLASNVASLPIAVYRRQSDGAAKKLGLPLMLSDPTAQGTRHDWLFRLVTSLAYRGNAVGLVTNRDNHEYVTRVEWLNPDDITVSDYNIFGPGSYTEPLWFWRGNPVPAEDLVHIPWFTLPGRVWGLSPIGAYAATVGVGIAAQEFQRDWFNAGGVATATFKNANATVDETQARVIKRRVVESIRTHEPVVYGKDWDYTAIQVAPHEAQFVDTLRMGATQIAAIYGIPPEMIGGDTGKSMTYSNTEQQAIQFVQFTMLPWVTKLEHAFNKLLPRGQYVKFNMDALIRPDMKTRYEGYEKSRLIGLNSVNELRALEDEEPIPGGDDYTPLAGSKVSSPAVRHLRVVPDEGE